MAEDERLVKRLKRWAGVEAAESGGMIPDPTETLYWAAAARIEELEEALKPFAAAWQVYEREGKSSRLAFDMLYPVDLRIAAAALAGKEPGQ